MLHIGARVPEESDKLEVKKCGSTGDPSMFDGIARSLKGIDKVEPIGTEVGDPGGRSEAVFNPTLGCSDADSEAVVLAHKDNRTGKVLVGRHCCGVEGRTGSGMV